MNDTSAPCLRTPRRAVSAMFVLSGVLFGVWASRIPAVAALHDLGPGELGLLLLLMGAGAIVAFPLAGHQADRIGAHPVTLRVAIAYAVALPLLAVAPETWSLALAVFVFGATHGAMDVAMNAWAGEVERLSGRPLMSSFHAMFSVGAGVGAATGYIAVNADLGLTGHFLAAGTGVAVLTLTLAWIDWVPDASGSARRTPVLSFPRGGLLAVGIVACCASFGEGAVADWSAIFLVRTTGVEEADAALGYATFSVSMVAMRLGGDRVVQALGPVVAARLAGATAATGVIVAVALPVFPMALAGFALMGAGYAIVMPLAFSRAANDPQIRREPRSRRSTLGYGGMLLGPPLIGFVAEGTSIRAAFLILAALALLLVALARAVRPAVHCNGDPGCLRHPGYAGADA